MKRTQRQLKRSGQHQAEVEAAIGSCGCPHQPAGCYPSRAPRGPPIADLATQHPATQFSPPTPSATPPHPAHPHRWQKGRDVYWYTRDVERSEADKQAELAMVKQREQDLMMEVSLGRETRRKAGATGGRWRQSASPGRRHLLYRPHVFDKRQRRLLLPRHLPSHPQALGMKPKAPKQLKQAQLDKADMQKLLQGTGGWRGPPGRCLPAHPCASMSLAQLCTVASAALPNNPMPLSAMLSHAGREQEEAGASGAAAAAAVAEADRIKGLGFHASMTTGGPAVLSRQAWDIRVPVAGSCLAACRGACQARQFVQRNVLTSVLDSKLLPQAPSRRGRIRRRWRVWAAVAGAAVVVQGALLSMHSRLRQLLQRSGSSRGRRVRP